MNEQVASLPKLRLAELMASMSLAIDLGVGQPMEWVMRACLLGVRLSKAMGLSEGEQRDVYYLSMLRHIGCTSTASTDARLFGDETSVPALMSVDPDDMAAMLKMMRRYIGKGQPLRQRRQLIAGIMAAGPELFETNHIGHCEVAERFIPMLNFDSSMQDLFWQTFERWDGKGIPHKLKGEAIQPAVRIIHLAQDAATYYAEGGIETAMAMVRQRANRLYDPAICDLFCQQAQALCTDLDTPSTRDTVLQSEPGQPVWLAGEALSTALMALADFTDVKSPHTLGHSRAVAELAEAAAQQCRLPEADVIAIRNAACLHDIGRVGISSAIWNKGGSLTESEWERVRIHPYYTERILSRSQPLAAWAATAALHHERLDGSGYHKGLTAPMLSPAARLLAAVNSYCALIESRPHRAARSPEQAAEEVRRQVRDGKLDGVAVDAVLAAAGHVVQRPRRAANTDLSERELDVLRLLVRGLSNRQMADQLVISQKTVGHHIQHIYNKIGVSTRAGATLYAVQNNLLQLAATKP